MSKGPGRVQRAILAQIAAEPDGAWPFERLCRLVYDDRKHWKPTRAQLGAVGRALKRITLPGTWTTGSFFGDRRSWLYDECSLASVRKMHIAHEDHFKPGGMYFEKVEKAKRFRDASPLERIEMRIADMKAEKSKIAQARAFGLSASDAEAATRDANERIKELE
jgi:hypothetical protein